MSMPSIPFSLASLKNAADELRGQFYPRNETEKRVSISGRYQGRYLTKVAFLHRCTRHSHQRTGGRQLRSCRTLLKIQWTSKLTLSSCLSELSTNF
jgi:hypothetical protein